MVVHEISRADARRLAVRAQMLDSPRPTDLLEVVRRLTLLQTDNVNSVAPSEHLVVWSRLGSAYSMDDMDDARADGTLIELQGMIRPGDDLVLYRADFAEWPGSGELSSWREGQGDWVDINDGFRLDILDLLRSDGPLTTREIPDTAVKSWKSSGWNNNRNVGMMLEMMEMRGETTVVGRRGRDRLWDLASRIYPDGPAMPSEAARRERDLRRLQSLGIARATAQGAMIEPVDVGPVGEEAVIEGVRGTWRVDPDQLGQPFHGRTALVSPLDRVIYDRKRMTDIFQFDYQLEMYKPAAKRRWGYWALPILYGDRFVGKVDATSDFKAGVFRVDAIHQDEPFDKTMAAAVHQEIEDLAAWLQLHLKLPK